MNVEIGTEAALFPENEYIKGIFGAVWVRCRSDRGFDSHPGTTTGSGE
jgi:hypothetical protein